MSDYKRRALLILCTFLYLPQAPTPSSTENLITKMHLPLRQPSLWSGLACLEPR